MSYADPLQLFRAAVEALGRENWRRVAELCDPHSLDAFKADVMATFKATPEAMKLTTAELLKAVPNMPRAVAEYQVQRFREQMDPRRRLHDEIPSIESPGALPGMKPSEVFAAWLDGRSLRREVERAVERKRMTRVMANEIVAERPRADYEALGFVNDGDRVCHIVYRASTTERSPRTIAAARQADDTWLLIADREFSLASRSPLLLVDPDEQDTTVPPTSRPQIGLV